MCITVTATLLRLGLIFIHFGVFFEVRGLTLECLVVVCVLCFYFALRIPLWLLAMQWELALRILCRRVVYTFCRWVKRTLYEY